MADFQEIVLGRKERGAFGAWVGAILVFGVYFALFQGPLDGGREESPAVPASLAAGRSVGVVDGSGQPLAGGSFEGRLPDDLVAGGLAGGGELGGALFLAPFVRIFNGVGFRIFHALVPALTMLAFFSFVHLVTGKRWSALLAALALVLNPFVLSYQQLNANHLALMMVALLFLLLAASPRRPLVAGLLCGALCTVRTMALLFVPILLLWLYLEGGRSDMASRWRRRLAGGASVGWFVLGTALALLPMAWLTEFMYGSLLTEPVSGAAVSHSFMGITFAVDGLLNYPFAENWVRTPHFPFPVFLLIPAVIIRSFGLFFFGIGLLGISAVLRTQPRVGGAMLAWAIAGCLFWSFQEGWSEQRMSYLFLALPPALLFVAYGLVRLTIIGRLRTNVALLVTVAVATGLLLKFSFFLEFPVDQRWYDRFPEAASNASGLESLPEELRLQPEFFRTRESPAEHLANKHKLTELCWWPCSYLPVGFDRERLTEMVAKESGEQRLTVRADGGSLPEGKAKAHP